MRQTPEEGKVLNFARKILLGQIPAAVVLLPAWLTLSEVEVPKEADMEAALARLPPGKPRFPVDTPRQDRVSVPLESIPPCSLVHLLMVAPFLSPFNAWHMMHVKAKAMDITQRVIPFMEWMRATTVSPQ